MWVVYIFKGPPVHTPCDVRTPLSSILLRPCPNVAACGYKCKVNRNAVAFESCGVQDTNLERTQDLLHGCTQSPEANYGRCILKNAIISPSKFLHAHFFKIVRCYSTVNKFPSRYGVIKSHCRKPYYSDWSLLLFPQFLRMMAGTISILSNLFTINFTSVHFHAVLTGNTHFPLN